MISSGAASQCVQKCSAERRLFFVDERVSWSGIERVMSEAEGLANGAADFGSVGLGAALGGYVYPSYAP
jgi:hypothetical protein